MSEKFDKIKTTFDVDAAIENATPEQLNRCVALAMGECYHNYEMVEETSDADGCMIDYPVCVECETSWNTIEDTPSQSFSTNWMAFGRAWEWCAKECAFAVIEQGFDYPTTFYAKLCSEHPEEWHHGASKESIMVAFCKALLKWELSKEGSKLVNVRITAARIREICA